MLLRPYFAVSSYFCVALVLSETRKPSSLEGPKNVFSKVESNRFSCSARLYVTASVLISSAVHSLFLYPKCRSTTNGI